MVICFGHTIFETDHIPWAYTAEYNRCNDTLKVLTKLQIILQATLQMMSLSCIRAFKALDTWAGAQKQRAHDHYLMICVSTDGPIVFD